MVATQSDLEQLAASPDANIPALEGWRRGLFGDDALALREGRLTLTGGEGGVKIERVGD
jgi:ribonuclease D